MYIDVTDEALISIREAAQLLPKVSGKQTHPSTLYRWCTKGCRGVLLAHTRLGSRLCTTPAALNEFAQSITAAGEPSE
jgi:hypothetical protein